MPKLSLFGNNRDECVVKEEEQEESSEVINVEESPSKGSEFSPEIFKKRENGLFEAREIKMDFSPTKLHSCFVTESAQKKEFDELVHRHEQTIEQ